jgi:hypothetical protein
MTGTSKVAGGGIRLWWYIAAAAVLVAVVSPDVGAAGRGEVQQPERVEGVIRLTGSEPFPSLVLTDTAGRDLHFSREDEEPFRSRVGETVCIRAVIHEETLTTPDGKFTVRRYNLKDPEPCDN